LRTGLHHGHANKYAGRSRLLFAPVSCTQRAATGLSTRARFGQRESAGGYSPAQYVGRRSSARVFERQAKVVALSVSRCAKTCGDIILSSGSILARLAPCEGDGLLTVHQSAGGGIEIGANRVELRRRVAGGTGGRASMDWRSAPMGSAGAHPAPRAR
jgi:hypothetical protein